MVARSVSSHFRKALSLVEMGEGKYSRAEGIEEEFEARRRASEACEDVFHGLVEVVNAILAERGVEPPQSHSRRMERLMDVGREDLARFYLEAKDALHTEGCYGQQFGPMQKMLIEEVRQHVEGEAERLGIEGKE